MDAVIVPKDRAVGLTPAVRKVASGAAEITPLIRVTNLVRTLKDLKEQGFWIYGAAGEASEALPSVRFSEKTAIVLGNEGDGLRRLVRETCDVLVGIPECGAIDSLNVSVASGIFLYALVAQGLA